MHDYAVKLRGVTEAVKVKAKVVQFGEHFVVFTDAQGRTVAGFASELVANVQREGDGE